MASIGFLHFTDLHVGMKELPADWPTIEAELLRDLEHMREQTGAWDLVVFSGDIVHSGQREQFDKAQAFLGRLWRAFREWDCEPRLVTVPGNHDLARPDDDLAATLLARWEEVPFRQDFWGEDEGGYRGRVRQTLAAYERWWEGLCRAPAPASTPTPPDELSRLPVLAPSATGGLPGDFTSTFEKDGVALGLLGLNTTFLQLDDNAGEGTLAVDKYQIQAACEGDLPAWVGRHDLCLLVTHHPPSWLSDRARRDLVDHAIDPAGPALHLCGHMHEPDQTVQSRNGSLVQRRLLGASLFGVEEWGTDRERAVHGYSSCRLDIEGDRTSLRIWPRRLIRPKGGGLRLTFDPDYQQVRGTEQIEPIAVPRHQGARKLEPSRSRAASALGELGFRIWRKGDADDALERERERLVRKFDQWRTAEQRKRGRPRLRVLWIVGEDVPYRDRGVLACLGQAAGAGAVVADAGRDLALAGAGLEWCLRNPPRSVALIALALDADQPQHAWIDVRNKLLAARHAAGAAEDEYAQLIVAGDERQAERAARALEALVEITTVDGNGRLGARPHSYTGVVRSSERVFNRGLPMTTRELFGRDADLRLLRDAWDSERTRLISVVAFGGTGKSSLVNEWLREMEQDGYRGATKVLAWSFYSQGTRENFVSADDFVNFALDWLGEPEGGRSLSPGARGERLASLIKRQRRFLLVLDGMEPLQHPLDAPEGLGGRLTDLSLLTLLDGLSAEDWDGLCVITTRVELTDLRPFEGQPDEPSAVRKLPLRNLDDLAGSELLERLIGRKADFGELQQVVKEVEGHALALTLLGNYLRDVHGGDLAGRVDLERLTGEEREGGHAHRVMSCYSRWLRERDDTAALAILHLIGLFDRPAEPTAMAALLAAPGLDDLSAGLRQVGGDAWNGTVEELQRMGLLNEDAPDWPGVLDAHPLVREHFRDELQLQPSLWELGNRVLFGHYRDLPADHQPSERRSMGALYAAVTHGCAAGDSQEVFDEVLLERIWRDRRSNFSTRRLGLTGDEIAALSNYFEHRRWTKLSDLHLSASAQSLIRTNAGVRLRQIGRLMDARECFAAALAAIDQRAAGTDELLDASYAAAQLCELLVIAGKLDGATSDAVDGTAIDGASDRPASDGAPVDGAVDSAVDDGASDGAGAGTVDGAAQGVQSALAAGWLAVEYSDRVDDPYFAMHARSSLAEARFMLGQPTRAGELFEQARSIEGARPPFLYSQSLYRYGYFLIETGRASEILAGEQSEPDWGGNGEDSSLLSRAIALAIRGAARRALIESGEASPELIGEAGRLMDEAMIEFRAAGYPDYIVRGLLERASLHIARGRTEDYALALADLDRAALEAGRGQMDLLAADVLLERARCRLSYWSVMTSGQRDEVAAQLGDDLFQATQLVSAIGYGRRERMLERLRLEALEQGIRIEGQEPEGG